MKKIFITSMLFLWTVFLKAQDIVNTFTDFGITNLVEVNSEFLDFGTSFYNDGIVFSSNRKRNIWSCKDPKTKGGFADIYFSQEENGTYKKPTRMGGQIKSKYHDGVPTFNAAGNRMIISRSNQKGKNSNKSIVVKLYETQLVDGKWTKLKELPFCSDDFSTMHPVYSPSGNTLTFASNRPNGYGGMDIYSVSFENGVWGKPVNAGKTVNQSTNEVFPFTAKNGVLYFSSNGHESMGGLDVFAYKKASNSISRLKDPINTTSDDFGFAVKSDGVTGFLSSNRVGGLGHDDIYAWQSEIQAKEMMLCAEDESGNSLADTDLEIAPDCSSLSMMSLDEAQNANSFLTTGKDGKVRFSPIPNVNYSVVIRRKGFNKVTKMFNGSDIEDMECFILKTENVWLEGTTYNKKTGDLLANTQVEIRSSCSEDIQNLTTDHKGYFKVDTECGCDYWVQTYKDGYTIDSKAVVFTDCEVKEKKFRLTPSDKVVSKPKPATPKIIPKPIIVRAPVAKPAEETIFVQDVYYNFDKYNIRPDASERLDGLVNILARFPTITVSMSSHTDLRGSLAYNERLSNNRANAARDYLLKKGVAPARVTIGHEGELNPRIDEITCDETSHQLNRRTEIRVANLPENVIVSYLE